MLILIYPLATWKIYILNYKRFNLAKLGFSLRMEIVYLTWQKSYLDWAWPSRADVVEVVIIGTASWFVLVLHSCSTGPPTSEHTVSGLNVRDPDKDNRTVL